jgi:DNA-binding PadR family transcriptional regulator
VYELMVLSLLMHWPLHAYLIARMTNNIIGPWEQISKGTLSALLTRLEHEGLIAAADPDNVPFRTGHQTRAFSITAAGRERFHELMLDTRSNLGNYPRVFHIKALHLEFLPTEEQLALVDHYLAYCAAIAGEERDDAQTFAQDPVRQAHVSSAMSETALSLMALKAQQSRVEVAWAQKLRERIVSRGQQVKATSGAST